MRIYHRCKTMSKEIGDDDVIDDIIKSKSRSKFWTTVTFLIFKLERRTKAQHVGNWTGYFHVILISKSSLSLQLSSLSYEWSSFGKFWQVHNLWLPFHYSPKFRRNLQVCRFVFLSVCLSVSLSVLSSITHERFDISSANLIHICTE